MNDKWTAVIVLYRDLGSPNSTFWDRFVHDINQLVYFFFFSNPLLILDPPHSHDDGRYLHNISNCGSQSFLMIYSCEVEFHGILERFFVDGFTMQIPWKPPLPSNAPTVLLHLSIINNHCDFSTKFMIRLRTSLSTIQWC